MTRAAIKHGEERLRRATLTGDVAELDALLSDRALFTGSDGAVLRKEDDLAVYRNGTQKITRYEPSAMAIELHTGGSSAVVSVRVELEGVAQGAPFAGIFRYTRLWAHEDGVFKIVAAHASAVTASRI